MTEFDLCIGCTEAGMNAALADLYSSLEEDLFRGSERAAGVAVRWAVEEAPRVDLAELDGPGPDDAKANLFALELPRVVLEIGDKQPLPRVELAVRSTASVEVQKDGSIRFGLGNLEVELSGVSAVVGKAVRQVIVPALTSLLRIALQALRTPPVQLPGVPVTHFEILITSDRIFFFANLERRGPPRVPRDRPEPVSAFFVLISDRFRLEAARTAVDSVYKRFEKSGTVRLGGLELGWFGEACLSDAQISLADPLSFRVTGRAAGKMQLELRRPLQLTLSFNLYPDPVPNARLSVRVQDGTLKVVVQDLDSFRFRISPTGRGLGRVLAQRIEPVATALSQQLVPAVAGLAESEFDAWTIEDVPFDVDGRRFIVVSREHRIAPLGSCLEVGAELGVRFESASTSEPS